MHMYFPWQCQRRRRTFFFFFTSSHSLQNTCTSFHLRTPMIHAWLQVSPDVLWTTPLACRHRSEFVVLEVFLTLNHRPQVLLFTFCARQLKNARPDRSPTMSTFPYTSLYTCAQCAAHRVSCECLWAQVRHPLFFLRSNFFVTKLRTTHPPNSEIVSFREKFRNLRTVPKSTRS